MSDDEFILESTALGTIDTLEWECEWAGDCGSRTEPDLWPETHISGTLHMAVV